jgi:hypothetical protein
MVNVASLVPQPLVFFVLSLTVAKVDSMGLVVRMWIQCSAGKSYGYDHRKMTHPQNDLW